MPNIELVFNKYSLRADSYYNSLTRVSVSAGGCPSHGHSVSQADYSSAIFNKWLPGLFWWLPSQPVGREEKVETQCQRRSPRTRMRSCTRRFWAHFFAQTTDAEEAGNRSSEFGSHIPEATLSSGKERRFLWTSVASTRALAAFPICTASELFNLMTKSVLYAEIGLPIKCQPLIIQRWISTLAAQNSPPGGQGPNAGTTQWAEGALPLSTLSVEEGLLSPNLSIVSPSEKWPLPTSSHLNCFLIEGLRQVRTPLAVDCQGDWKVPSFSLCCILRSPEPRLPTKLCNQCAQTSSSCPLSGI